MATKNMQSERRGRGVLETVNILNAVHAELSGGFEYLLNVSKFLNLPVAIFR
jgi:hypothetical protein